MKGVATPKMPSSPPGTMKAKTKRSTTKRQGYENTMKSEFDYYGTDSLPPPSKCQKNGVFERFTVDKLKNREKETAKISGEKSTEGESGG